MMQPINAMDYFRAVANSVKFQISAAISFGGALLLIWLTEGEFIKIALTIFFLFAFSMLLISIFEKIWQIISVKIRRKKEWSNLTPEETEIISYYISKNTKTKYVECANGTYSDSGLYKPLINKGILYLSSNIPEYRAEDDYGMNFYVPINIHDNAFEFFSKK